jgi:hypothetical protein
MRGRHEIIDPQYTACLHVGHSAPTPVSENHVGGHTSSVFVLSSALQCTSTQYDISHEHAALDARLLFKDSQDDRLAAPDNDGCTTSTNEEPQVARELGAVSRTQVRVSRLCSKELREGGQSWRLSQRLCLGLASTARANISAPHRPGSSAWSLIGRSGASLRVMCQHAGEGCGKTEYDLLIQLRNRHRGLWHVCLPGNLTVDGAVCPLQCWFT